MSRLIEVWVGESKRRRRCIDAFKISHLIEHDKATGIKIIGDEEPQWIDTGDATYEEIRDLWEKALKGESNA